MLANRRSILAGIFVFSACFSCNTASNEGFSSFPKVEIDIDAIAKRGYITALVDNNSISYFIYKGQAMGYEYELLKLIAKELKVGLKIKVTSGVERAIEQLNNGEGDILAFPLTITKSRRNFISFTNPHFNTYQVLVQRKQEGWDKQDIDHQRDGLIRNPVQLIGKEVHVIKGTSFEKRIMNLSEEIGGDIDIRYDSMTSESESIIKRVANGEIDYTVSDYSMARVNAAYYPNIDVNTVLSVPQQIAWAVRKNSPRLKSKIDKWLVDLKKEPTFMVIYNRYYKSPRTSLMRMQSDYSSIGVEAKLSPYDDLIRLGATKLEWDWLLLASLVYQESKFNAQNESWAGARGLMQLMPETAKRFGAQDPDDPEQSMKAAINYLTYLNTYWLKRVPDSNERLKFVLASYNAGLSHVIDASNLASKHNLDPSLWKDNVEYCLSMKSEPEFYRDPVVKAGYCRCSEPISYVSEILERYDEYKTHLSDDSIANIQLASR